MSQVVRISGPSNALILHVPQRGMPEIVYFGPDGLLHDVALESVPSLLTRSHRVNGMDQQVPHAVLLPAGGMGFFGWPAIAGHRDGQDFIIDPAGWQIEASQDAFTLTGPDTVSGVTVILLARITGTGALVMSSSLTNDRAGAYTLDRCMAGSLVIEAEQDSITTFEGNWGAEFHMRRETLGSALWIKENRRGRTSHDRFPGVLFEERQSTDFGGTVTGAHLAWSGNHITALDRLDDGRRLLHMGELFEPGEMRLATGERYDSPEMVVVRDWQGLDGVTARFHDHVRSDVLSWHGGTMVPRPVLLNTWEGNYFTHDVETLKAQASAAARLGIERFVLDDGWFGLRDDDRSSLGDWFIDPRKYPDGLTPLITHVNSLGMDFGLWFEPEMINVDSDLYRAHPDWVLQVKGRPLLDSRFQQVLDISRKEVSDYLFERMDDVLGNNAIAFVKWDMNRDLSHAAGPEGRPMAAKQTRAFLALIARIRAAHPSVEIESCSSGGGRLDYAALHHAHRVWVSDCTDALERLEIQRSASIFLPPEVMGAHFSNDPGHQTHRRHSVSFRALMAMPYHFGVEVNPLTLPAEEFAELAGYIALHKRLRPLLHGGVSFRQPELDGRHVFGVRSEDGRHAVAIIAQSRLALRELPAPIRIPELDPDVAFRLSVPAPQKLQFQRARSDQLDFLTGSVAVPSGLLQQVGFHLPTLYPESAILIEFTPDTAGGR
jgi:alpha-galactosidase